MKKWNSKHRSNPNKKALSPPNEPCTNLLKSNRPNLLSTDVLKDKSFYGGMEQGPTWELTQQ